MIDEETFLEMERRVLDGSVVSRDELLPVFRELFELRQQAEGARRILSRWGRVAALLDYLQRTHVDGWLSGHIEHVLRGIGGQP